jgi:manganese/zinc/iron transport system permease protein
MILAVQNPYFALNFAQVLLTFVRRLYEGLGGGIGLDDLAADEVQVLVLACVALSSALLGSFLVLRRMTMLANSLSHTILLGITLSYLWQQSVEQGSAVHLPSMLMAAILTGLLTTLLTEFLAKVVGLQEDASTGLVFTSLFALSVVLLTAFSRNAHIGSEVLMGSADALQASDLRFVAWVALANLAMITVFYKELKLTTFDTGLASVLGISAVFFNYLLMTQVSVTVVGAFRAVGVLMVLAFITGPALTARLITHRLGSMLLLSGLIGIFSSIVGVALARHILTMYHVALSTAGLTVCVVVFLFCLAAIFAPEQGLLARRLARGRVRSAMT